MVARVVNKQLAGLEDLLLGSGTEEQERYSGTREITKINMLHFVASIDAVRSVDYTQFLHVQVESNTTANQYYFDPNATADDDGLEVLLPVTAPATGRWLRQAFNASGSYTRTTTESQVASAGQTVFTLRTIQYVKDLGSIQVHINGVYQNPDTYTEFSDGVTITFSSALEGGDAVDFTVGEVLGSAPTADLISYTPAGTGAVTTNVQDKLREFVSVKDFGAVGDGVTNDTAAIQDALDTGLPVYLPNEIYVIKGTLYLGSSRLFGDGTLKIVGDSSWSDLGTGLRNNEGAILTKASAGAGYGITSQQIDIDGITILLERTHINGPDTALLVENVNGGKIRCIIKPTGSTLNSVNALDLYLNNNNIEITGTYISGVAGQSVGLSSIRNISGGGNTTSNIMVHNAYFESLAADEGLAVYNANGFPGDVIRNVNITNCTIVGAKRGFSWLNNADDPAEDFGGCSISNSTIVVHDLEDGAACYVDENVGALASNINAIIRSSTHTGGTVSYGFWLRDHDGLRPAAKLSNCRAVIETAPSSQTMWAYSGTGDLIGCESYSNVANGWKFSIRGLAGTVTGGDFAYGSTNCVYGCTRIVGATLRGTCKNVTYGLQKVLFGIDMAQHDGATLIEYNIEEPVNVMVDLDFNVQLSNATTERLSRVILGNNSTSQKTYAVEYHLNHQAALPPTNDDFFVATYGDISKYEVIWNSAGTLTRKTKILTI